jgi:UDP-glucose 4-epimerase
MKVLVTGAAGFIGGHVLRRLLAAGHEPVALILQPDQAASLPREIRQVVVCDLASLKGAADIPSDCQAVIHLAGRLGGWRVSQQALQRDNVAGTENLLAALAARGIQRLIHASTPGVLGFAGIAEEDLPYAPRGPYERSKAQAERSVLERGPGLGLSVLVLRPDFVYGPGDQRRLGLLRAWRDGTFFYVAGGGALVHPTYVADAADAFVRALDSKLEQIVLNIAGPRPVTWRELAETGSAILRVRPPRYSLPRPLAQLAGWVCERAFALAGREPPITASRIEFMSRDHASSTARARDLLGWQAPTDLETGLRSTIAWARSQGLL